MAIAFFYSDISLNRVFQCFDINSDGIITRNEFFYGMSQLDLGKIIPFNIRLRSFII